MVGSPKAGKRSELIFYVPAMVFHGVHLLPVRMVGRADVTLLYVLFSWQQQTAFKIAPPLIRSKKPGRLLSPYPS